MKQDEQRELQALVVTALPVEYSATREHLTNIEERTHPEGTIYEAGTFRSEGVAWRVGLVKAGKGGTNAAFETERALHYFQPSILLFVGIAGGLKDVRIGDVVAATKVYGYESGKVSTVFNARPDIGLSTYRMEQRADVVARQQTWRKRIRQTFSAYEPQVFVAPIVAGEKVLASTQSALYDFLKLHFNDALAIEMEAHGFLTAAHANQRVEALVVRGISDLLDNKHEAEVMHSQEIASQHASAFAFAVLASLGNDPSFRNPTSVAQVRDAQSKDQGSKYNTNIYGSSTVVQGDGARITIHNHQAKEERK